MNTKGIDVKERIRAVIVDWYKLKMPDQRLIELRAILADLEAAEPPKPTGYKNRVQVCPECNIDMYQDISTKNAGFWVWYCPECGQEIKIT